MIKNLFLIIFLGCFCSCVSSKKIVQSGSRIEVTERDFKNDKKDWKSAKCNIRFEFYDIKFNDRPIGFMTVSINKVLLLSEIDGVFETWLYNGYKYKFEYFGTGYEGLKNVIKIKKDKEYLVKVFMKLDEGQILK